MSEASTAMEGEMVLLAMLPYEEQVLLMQTPRARSVGELERFVVDEYARVFPHKSPLSRELRIQKCVSPEMVVNRRAGAHHAGRKAGSHFFVDLAKNVQVGNVFDNMEQVYVVLNRYKKDGHSASNAGAKPLALPPSHVDGVGKKNKNKQQEQTKQQEVKTKQNKPAAVDASAKPVALAKDAHSKPSKDAQAKDAAGNNTKRARGAEDTAKLHGADAASAPTVKKPKGENAPKKESVKEKSASAAQETTSTKVKKSVEKPSEPAASFPSPTKSAAAEVAATEANTARKAKKKKADAKVATDLKQPAAKRQKTETDANAETVKATKTSAEKNKSKKATPEKSPEVPSSQETVSDNTTVVGTKAKKAKTETPVGPAGEIKPKKKLGRPSNADKAAAAAAAATTEAQTEEPKPKKKLGRPSKADKEAAEATATVAAATGKPVEESKPKKKLGRPSKADKEAAEAAATAAAAAGQVEEPKPKKKLGRPSKADKEAAEAAAAAAAAAGQVEEPKPKKKPGRPAKADKAAAEAAVAAAPAVVAPEASAKEAKKPGQPASVAKSETAKPSAEARSSERSPKVFTFQDRVNAARSIIANDKKKNMSSSTSKDATPSPMTIVSEKPTTPTSVVMKQVDSSTDSESDTDSDDRRSQLRKALIAKKAAQSLAPVVIAKSSSSDSDSSDDEQLDYSQSLLADLTKNDLEEEPVATPPMKPQPSKANKVVYSQEDDLTGASQESSSSVDIPLAQSSQETNSLLTSSISKNRFSLDRIPVAKLKKSSKNPFASQDTSSTGVKRPGRPPKSLSQ